MDARPRGRTTRRIATGTAAATMSLALLVAGCGSEGSDGAATSGESTTTAATETTAATTDETTSTEADESPTTSPEDNSEGTDTETSVLDTLPDGDHYVFMAGLEDGMVEGQEVQVVIVDQVELLTGQEAIDAAAQDGETLDTDYYVRNTDQTVKRIAVVPEAQVTTLDGGTANTVPSSVSEVWNQPHLFKINVGNVRGITTISSIEPVYLA